MSVSNIIRNDPCAVCGKPVNWQKDVYGFGKCCSLLCYSKWNDPLFTNLTCPYCGGLIHTTVEVIK